MSETRVTIGKQTSTKGRREVMVAATLPEIGYATLYLYREKGQDCWCIYRKPAYTQRWWMTELVGDLTLREAKVIAASLLRNVTGSSDGDLTFDIEAVRAACSKEIAAMKARQAEKEAERKAA